jgi:RHS repeat-associated protein
VYDGFNRLTRENIKTQNFEQTILYTYDDYSDDTIPYVDTNTDDNRGNITSIIRYAYTLDENPSDDPLSETKLFYKTSGWKDEITRVEEHVGGTLQKTSTYVYDSIGNLISITSDTNQSIDFEGRRLVEHIIGGVIYTYTYNDQGIRTSVSNGTTTTEYFLEGSLVLFEKTGNDAIYYTYDVDGSLLSMNYNDDEYFYIKNLQGDIIEIVDASGNTVARYRYDAWGNIVHFWDSGLGIADINPYRYRSYRFDTETGLYYFNARYYDSSIGRFISADSINYLDPSNEQGLNLYAYGNNNPVMHVDPSGESFLLILGAIFLGGTIGGFAGIFGGAENEEWYSSFLDGFINSAINTIGLAAALATGGFTAILWAGGMGFLGGFLGNTVSQLISGDDFNPMIAILHGGISAATNLAVYWGAATFIKPRIYSFQEVIMPSEVVFAAESYLRQYIPNLSKQDVMNYALFSNKHINELIIDFSRR